MTRLSANALANTSWELDPANSSFEFRVRHFWGLTTVTGHFDRFDGSLEIDGEGNWQMSLTIDAASLDTGHEKRDTHLRSAEFFAAEEHPAVRFTSTSVTEAGEGRLHVTGDLEAAGKRIPLTFDATVRDVEGGRLEIEATAIADHRELGMTWSPLGTLRPPSTLIANARLARRSSANGAGP
jgi:polyisoprenoid-binding protein YceI